MAKQFTDEREKKFYRAWGDMKHRCNTPTAKAYPKYGGRGIKVCEDWHVYNNFKRDMWDSYLEHLKQYGTRQTTLDRIDPNGNYTKENCAWATYQEQRMHVRNKAEYVATEIKTGKKIYFNNCTEFCKENNFTRSGITACCAKERSSHKGYTFERLTEKEREGGNKKHLTIK